MRRPVTPLARPWGQTLNAIRHTLPARRPSGSPVSGGPSQGSHPYRVTRADMSLNQEG